MKPILAVTGKPGLYTLLSRGKGMLFVENIETKKRMPVYAADKVISLNDVAMYSYNGDVPLADIFQAVADKNGNAPVDMLKLKSAEQLREAFGEVLPDFDRERVYPNDIKKMFAWYNILVANGVTDFKDEDIAEDKAAGDADPDMTYDTKDTGLEQ